MNIENIDINDAFNFLLALSKHPLVIVLFSAYLGKVFVLDRIIPEKEIGIKMEIFNKINTIKTDFKKAETIFLEICELNETYSNQPDYSRGAFKHFEEKLDESNDTKCLKDLIARKNSEVISILHRISATETELQGEIFLYFSNNDGVINTYNEYRNISEDIYLKLDIITKVVGWQNTKEIQNGNGIKKLGEYERKLIKMIIESETVFKIKKRKIINYCSKKLKELIK